MNRLTTTLTNTTKSTATPYSRLTRNVRLLRMYMEQDRPASLSADTVAQQEYEKLDYLVTAVGRKPNVCLLGSFDAGKSTLANILLEKDNIPVDFQPTTSLPTFIRHISDRPSWLQDEVYILSATSMFNSRLLDNESRFYSHVEQSGPMCILHQYATHQEESEEEEDNLCNALVFCDSPILETCNLIDYPGYDNDDVDDTAAKSSEEIADIVLYLSNFAGFLSGIDLTRIGSVIRNLPDLERADQNFSTLGNLYLIGTHKDPKKLGKEKLHSVFRKASSRIYKHLGKSALAEKSRRIDRRIGEETLANRMTTFWVDEDYKDVRFEVELYQLLSRILPPLWIKRADSSIEEFRRISVSSISQKIDQYQRRLKEIGKLEDFLDRCIEEEPERKIRVNRKRTEIENAISAYAAEGRSGIKSYYYSTVSESGLERIIRNQYSDKKEASENAAMYVVELLQERIKKILEPKTRDICEKTNTFLGEYSSENLFDGGIIDVGITFDQAAAFSAGIAKVAALSAFTVYGAAMGGFWIAANTTGIIASIGLGVGSVAAALASALGHVAAAVTGPIGLAALAGVALVAMFRGPWQKRLAKKIVEKLSDENLLSKLEKAIQDYWNSSAEAFKTGADEVEQQWQQELKQLRYQVEHPEEGRISIEETIRRLSASKDFFSSLPWDG